MWWFVWRPVHQAARVIIINQDQVLMIRHTYGFDTWTFPGGKAESQESPEAVAKREVSEEVGIVLDKVELIGSYQFDSDYKTGTMYVLKSMVNNSSFNIDPVEIAEAKWFPLNNLPIEMGPNAKKIFSLYKK